MDVNVLSYCVILCDIVGYCVILWDIMGYCGILWDIMGYCGILWDIVLFFSCLLISKKYSAMWAPVCNVFFILTRTRNLKFTYDIIVLISHS